MVKKETIGKTQLILGIILLLVGIIGVILAYNWFNNQMNDHSLEMEIILEGLERGEDFNSYSEDSKLIIKQGMVNLYSNNFLLAIILSINLGLLFILSIIISLLFITQGLVNMKQTNKQKW